MRIASAGGMDFSSRKARNVFITPYLANLDTVVVLTITPVNHVYVQVACDDAIAQELSEYFAFDVPGARFMQAKFGKHWSGKIKLFTLRNHYIYRGLLPRILEFADARDYPVVDHTTAQAAYHVNTVRDSVANLHLPLIPRDYQLDALRHALNSLRCIILSPTGSGKSLIIYMLEELLAVRTLIIVPTLGLVTQMVNDFKSYGCSEAIQIIQGGTTKVIAGRLTVSTWQSIYEQPASYFDQFGCVMVDEVHTAKAKSLTELMKKCTTAQYRFGFTGTMDNTDCHRLVLEGLFGAVQRVASTADLVKAKQLTPLRIKMCVLEYPDALKKELRRLPYETELDAIVTMDVRNEFIARLVTKTHGNTLVLFQFVEKHGLGLYQRISALAKGKTVHYIAGSVDGDERERIRQALALSDDNILVASYGTVQLGTNIPNLCNLVMAHPAKSSIRVLQSIGRVLRLAEGKDYATLYDLADDLRVKRYTNHLWHHAEARTQYYSTEHFPMTMAQVNMEAFAMATHTALGGSGTTTDIFGGLA
jgi:superfamily II DNA or RNA helicase